MEEDYDVIVLGTGLQECILSGLMSVAGKKVLHIDRNNYYGGESASLNLDQLYKKFAPEKQPPADFGRSRDWNVDLCPKFLMACGNLVKVLLHTQVTRYLDFRKVAGSFVLQDGKVQKVPATPVEAVNSSLMGFFQKHKFKNFLQYSADYDEKDAKTWKGYDLNKMTAADLYKEYGLDANTQAFTGHSIALYEDETYLQKPARDLVDRLKLYAWSLQRYGSSPYLYPAYGLGGLPEGFSRLCAVHGGVYMLNKPIKRILFDNGVVSGIEDLEGKTAKCKQLICDPSYVIDQSDLSNKIVAKGKIIRAICILSHPVADTNNADSCQIIIPSHSVKGRSNDIYVCVTSYHHNVAADGKYIAVLSTKLEGEEKSAESELAPAMNLLGKVDEKFVWVSNFYEATDDGTQDQLFVTRSYDSQSHFESATEEVLRLYKNIMNKELDLSIAPDLNQE